MKRSHATKDRLFADAFSLTSRGLKFLPPLDKMIVGDNTVPRGWQHGILFGHSDHWVDIAGDPQAPPVPIPRLYRQEVVIGISGEQIEQQAHDSSFRHAIALKLGEEMVFGALADELSFAQAENDPLVLLARLRRGRGSFQAMGGVWDQRLHHFHGANSLLYEADAANLPRDDIPLL